jgi:hypothetical protein
MTRRGTDIPAMEDPGGSLGQALVEEYFRARGIDPAALHALPEVEARRLLTEASVYASTKLAEIEARAHFVQEIHSDK